MLYLSQMLGKPVVDSNGEEIGRISDMAISTGEVFPRITSLAFMGPAKTPFMISWRKYVEEFDGEKVILNADAPAIRFSYLQPDEILLARDLMNRQIVDTQGLKVVRVNDLKLSVSYNKQLRLLGAEVGTRGILRGISVHLENLVVKLSELFKHPMGENIIAWNYMDLLDRDLSQVKLSVTHHRLHELHPADIADILEQLDPQQRGTVFEHLDNQQAAEAISELEDEYQADLIDDLPESRASQLLATMEPDDAADIIADLPYDKAEQILWLMGVQDQRRIRSLLGFKEKSAGGIMTTEFLTLDEAMTVSQAIERIRSVSEEIGNVHYVYVVDDNSTLIGVVSLRELVLADDSAVIGDIATRELVTADPDDDQEEVANNISKYNLLAMPVVDEGKLIGIVTVDDAFDVLEEEHDEDLQIAGAVAFDDESDSLIFKLFRQVLRRGLWFILWIAAAFAVLVTGTLSVFAGALLLMPIVLLMADDATQFAINDLLDYSGDEEDRVSLGRLFGRDLVVGLLIAIIVGLLLLAFGSAASDLYATPALLASGLIEYLTGAILPTVITCVLIMLCSVLFTARARRLLDKDRNISNTAMTIALMVVGIILQFALVYLMAVIL